MKAAGLIDQRKDSRRWLEGEKMRTEICNLELSIIIYRESGVDISQRNGFILPVV